MPMQLIYKGKTERSLPDFSFPKDFRVTQTPNHSSNEKTKVELLRQIVIPFVEKKRKLMKLPDNHPWLLIADVFKAQWTDVVKEIVSKSHRKIVPIPNNWTNHFKPLDLSVKKCAKNN